MTAAVVGAAVDGCHRRQMNAAAVVGAAVAGCRRWQMTAAAAVFGAAVYSGCCQGEAISVALIVFVNLLSERLILVPFFLKNIIVFRTFELFHLFLGLLF